MGGSLHAEPGFGARIFNPVGTAPTSLDIGGFNADRKEVSFAMGSIFRFFVENPKALFIAAGIFLASHFLGRSTRIIRQPRYLLFPSTALALWGVWELMIRFFSPEADIRVDLLLIVPAVLLATTYGVIKSLIARHPR